MNDGAPLIRVAGVSKTFTRRGASTRAIGNVDLDVAAGEFVSLLGPSGCGKSTLLRVIGGLVDADRGDVSIGGEDPHVARDAKRFGLVPQTPALLPWKTVSQNVGLLNQLNKKAAAPKPLDDATVRDLLEEVGLGRFLGAYPHELSGGMQQRVSLVRAFALGAPILLMDEPFAALDEFTRTSMRYLLLELWERAKTTVVFVTHSIPEAVILSDRVVVLAARPGRIAATETITLPRPRHEDLEDSDGFHEHVARLRHELKQSHLV
jgi:NitT/TauT family transport system ATP-binding protein